ncbi:MAG: S9 family peptidase [Steroidobacteraceae bacterium]|nr:S9 family peptidase [Steroidobacteraceae bacterium]
MQTLPYGTWPAPISAADLARSSITLGYVRTLDGVPYWVESRPDQGGRYVIVTPGEHGKISELTPNGFNARTRVHEYGGLPYAVARDAIYFSNFADQRLYVQPRGEAPRALTPEGYRYADFELDRSGTRLFCVREDHTSAGEPKNAVVSVPAAGGTAGTVLFGESDFVAYPRVSPDGTRLAWIAWNHPDMPWDGTRLYVANLVQDRLEHVTLIAGGPRESVLEPAWDRDGTLYFISDRSDWWNLYRWTGQRTEPVLATNAEFATPLWVLGQSNFALTGDGRAVVRYGVRAQDRLGVLDLRSGQLRTLDTPFVSVSSVALLSPESAVAIAASPVSESAVVRFDLNTGACETLRAPGQMRLGPASISCAEPIEFPTDDGRTAHAFFYPPKNAEFTAPAGERPPLVVKVHGGPTSHARAELSLATQFWTSRGFAFLDVNHGGSSGFGRAYRERLEGNWGVVDVADVVAAVRYLAAQGRIDINRVAIRGGSAGGFTVLAALAFHGVFKAGANYYGVSDLESLAHDTHKFESRYLDRLVAPLPAGRALYEARAPIRHLDHFREPLITFQGAEDKVVPPSQSREIVAALQRRGVPVAYVEFEGEQHGFRKAESIVRSLEAELAFYGEVFGFTPAGALPPVPWLEGSPRPRTPAG